MSKTTFFTVKSPKIMVLTSLPPTPRQPHTTPQPPLDARARSLAKSLVGGGRWSAWHGKIPSKMGYINCGMYNNIYYIY